MFTPDDEHSPQVKGICGVIAPIALTIYGISVLTTGHATLRSSRFGASLELWDLDAQLWGVSLLAGAVALHAMLFWRDHPRVGGYAPIAATVALLIVIYAIFWLLSRRATNFI